MRMAIKNSLAAFSNTRAGGFVLGVSNNLGRKLDSFNKYTNRQRRCGASRDLKSTLVSEFFPDLIVKNGPFVGMKYPSAQATGSAMLPKLLGSYEDELLPAIKTFMSRGYTEIVDVGCAEGYYAVGFGRCFPEAKIYAYDVNSAAQEMCKAMGDANNIGNQLTVKSFCDQQSLRTLNYRGRALIVSDCEGYEKDLFDENIVDAMRPHDLLIECHDHMSPEISGTLEELFHKSHDIQKFYSLDTYRKAYSSQLPQLAECNFETRKFMVDEARGCSMIWLAMISRL